MKSSPALQLSADISKELSWKKSGKKQKKNMDSVSQWDTSAHNTDKCVGIQNVTEFLKP